VILYSHAHGNDYVRGKDELVDGNALLQKPSWADALAQMGYAVLCIDLWMFGERRGRAEGELFRQMLWSGQVLWGMMVFDSLRALDYLEGRDDVDAARIGTLGMSMGSTMSWWVAALDTRVKVCVDICCLGDFDALIATRALERHGLYYWVPGLLKHFSAGEINALIAPRPHLALAGIYDPLTPLEGLQRIDAYLRETYTACGHSDAWQLSAHPCGHIETAAMRAEAIDFIGTWL
jgi:dienelactone hydrolase